VSSAAVTDGRAVAAAESERRCARGRALCIAVPAALAAGLSLVGLTARSLGFDEAATVAIASQHGAALWRAIAHDGGNMSGYYVVMHVLIGLFGDGLVVLRLPSVLAAAATAGLVAAIGRRLCDPLAGLAAGVMMAVSLPLVYWAQTARAYAPMLAFVCAGLLAFVALAEEPERLVEEPQPSGAGRSRRWWWLYVAAMALACYCSIVAVLIVPVELVAVLWRPAARRRLVTALVVLAVLCVPLLVLALRRGSGQLFWVPRPSSRVITQVLESITSAGLESTFHRTATTYALIAVTLVVLGVVLVALGWLRRRGDVWALALLLASFAIPVLLTFVVSLFAQPIFVARNILITVPAGTLAIAVALAQRGVPRAVLLAVVAVVVTLRVLALVPTYGVSPEPWRAATAAVLSRASPGDCAVFYPEDARSAFGYYVVQARAAGRAPRSILPLARWSQTRADVEAYVTLSPATLRVRAAGCRRMWIISSHEGEPDGPPQSRINRARFRRLRGEVERLFGTGAVLSYGYASTIHVELAPGR
jgi:mannosyltransferase